MEKDTLGQRMKGYEQVSKFMLTPKIPIVIRLDGKAFHTFTKPFKRPFDERLIKSMQDTTEFLVNNIQNCVMGYTQSDEITLVLLDMLSEDTETWFNGGLQKIASVSASMCTAYFNNVLKHDRLAFFDSRVFQLPLEDLPNNIVWRMKGCYKNAITSVAHCHYSQKQLHGVSTKDRLELIKDKYLFKDEELFGTLFYKKLVTDGDLSMKTLVKENKLMNYYEIKEIIQSLGYKFDGLDLFWSINKGGF